MFQLRIILWVCEFLGAFVKLQTKLLAASGLSVCPSVSPNETTRLSMDRFSSNPIFEYFFSEICGEF